MKNATVMSVITIPPLNPASAHVDTLMNHRKHTSIQPAIQLASMDEWLTQ